MQQKKSISQKKSICAKYCAFCGQEMSPSDITQNRGSCRSSCHEKLKSVQKKITDLIYNLKSEMAQYNNEEVPLNKRNMRDEFWERLYQPVMSPAHCIEAIGYKKVVTVLAEIHLNGYVADRIDLRTYKILVGNTWCDFDDKLYWELFYKTSHT